MKLPNFIKAWIPAAGFVPQLWDSSWRAAAGMNPYSGLPGDPTPQESLTLSAVHRSVAVLADSIAAAPKRLVQESPAGGMQLLVGTDVARAVATVDYGSWEGLIFDTCVQGNGYLKVGRNARGGAESLTWIAGWRVSIEVDDASGAYRYKIAADGNIGSPETTLQPAEVVHLRYRLSGRHPLLGVTPLVDLAPSLGAVVQHRETGKSIYRNLALPSTVLLHPKRLSTQARDRLKDSWTTSYSGDKKAGTAVLEEGMQVETIPINQLLEAQYAELAQVGVREAARCFGVPPVLLGEPGDVNFSTSAEMMRSFHSATLKPFGIRVADAINHTLLSRDERAQGVTVAVDLSAATRGYGNELADFTSKMLNSGAVAIDEARHWLGLPPVENGEILRAPANCLPLDIWVNHDPSEAAQAGAMDDAAKALPDTNQQLEDPFRVIRERAKNHV